MELSSQAQAETLAPARIAASADEGRRGSCWIGRQ